MYQREFAPPNWIWALALLMAIGIIFLGFYDENRINTLHKTEFETNQTLLADNNNLGKVIGIYYEYSGKGALRTTLAVVEFSKTQKRIGVPVRQSLPVVGETWKLKANPHPQNAFEFTEKQ